ncbi:hypothetical protein C4D60_Mb09t11940 [Musa balbisiana]|uniref:SLC26A/SulP transporter domain-containing protein n=1 Tax=Musa balbisiana TaxID=52838 RepID=A0A4S8IFR3_MUSBA|nr:hypothetical protein C4D60_Mb09t11940 [Musa balbisiana]
MGHPVADEGGSKEMEIASLPSARHHHLVSRPSLYKVGCPTRKRLVREFTDALKETLFKDDPLRQNKDQSGSRKFMLGLRFLFPIFDWGSGYNLSKFKGDPIAGLTIDIGYAKLANPEPQYGLWKQQLSSTMDLSAMGISRDIAIGLAAVVSLLFCTLVQSEIDFVKLVFTANLLCRCHSSKSWISKLSSNSIQM